MGAPRKTTSRVALITGASRGIGRSIAEAMAKEGYHLALAGRDEEKLEEVAGHAQSLGAKALALPFELTDDAAQDQALERCVAHFGQLDVLVSNAGVAYATPSPGSDWALWESTLDVNLRATMRLAHRSIPHVVRSSAGALVFISSISGKITYDTGGAYCASKHGLQGFAGCLFEDLRGRGVKVTTICPGYVATEMAESLGANPDEVIQPDAVAAAVMFVLAFPESGCPTEIVIRSQTPPWA